jgi:RNA polymerase sigma-70 factor, ECF subfamily
VDGLVTARDARQGATLESADLVFGRLSDRALDRCYSLAGYLLGNSAEAQDATQDALARAWRARGTLHDPDAFEGWLDRILVNACMDRMRRRRLVRFVEIDPDGDFPAGDPFREFLARDELGRALGVLTPEQRVVVVLRFWRDLPIDEIARRMDCPAGTVKSRLNHAMTALRKRLESDKRLGSDRREVDR